jgi:2-polyprenyl-3-methyl-5-hydroxy-6-metoxy-1,4-benzoquinol methylase
MISAVRLADDATPIEKYVFKPLPGSSHHWALTYFQGNSSHETSWVKGKKVLDIGAGGGGMGRVLRELGAGEITAIEIDPVASAAIAPIYDAVYPDIQPIKGRTYDIILLLDVLEHMSDPFGFMVEVEKLLAPGGRAVISVPNVAHWSVRLGLLIGRFEYVSRGILDRTHLQFFTRRRFKELLSSVGSCTVEQMASSIEPVELVLPEFLTNNGVFRSVSILRMKIAQGLPGLMGYQHLGVIQKPL